MSLISEKIFPFPQVSGSKMPQASFVAIKTIKTIKPKKLRSACSAWSRAFRRDFLIQQGQPIAGKKV
jgi:hypothetical protein